MALNHSKLRKKCFEQVSAPTLRATMTAAELVEAARALVDEATNAAFEDEDVENFLRLALGDGSQTSTNMELVMRVAGMMDRTHRFAVAGEEVPEDVRRPQVKKQIREAGGAAAKMGVTEPF